MQGKIVKGIAGFYYVHVEGSGIYECKARGAFRKNKIKPLVGDDVRIQVLDQENMLGSLEEILPRKNELIRPAVANIDQALVIFSISKPSPNFNLLDRFLISMEAQHVPSIICFNKSDISSKEEEERLRGIYENSGCEIRIVSAKNLLGIDELQQMLKGRTTAVAGPSGVGKSSIINCLQSAVSMETGSISSKIDRGKHTTRHSELIAIDHDTYIMDTPGFSSLYLTDFQKEELKDYIREFDQYEPYCRFQGCVHIGEPDCGVKQAVSQGKISEIRYKNYADMFQELKDKRRF